MQPGLKGKGTLLLFYYTFRSPCNGCFISYHDDDDNDDVLVHSSSFCWY